MEPFVRIIDTESGSFDVRLHIHEETTDRSCEVCEGKRVSQMTTIYRIQLLSVVDRDGQEWSWEVFRKNYASIADEIRSRLKQRGFGKPVCIECQKDLFLPGRDHYSSS